MTAVGTSPQTGRGVVSRRVDWEGRIPKGRPNVAMRGGERGGEVGWSPDTYLSQRNGSEGQVVVHYQRTFERRNFHVIGGSRLW